MGRRTALLMGLALALGLAGPRAALALHVTVPKGASECFSVVADAGKHGLSLNYEVLRGVAEALDGELRDGAGVVVYRNAGAAGRFAGEVGAPGEHTVCFRNERAPVGDVVVGFSFHADDPSHEVLSNADATKISAFAAWERSAGRSQSAVWPNARSRGDAEQVQELEDLVYDLSVSLDTVKDTQEYMKIVKEYHNERAWLRAARATAGLANHLLSLLPRSHHQHAQPHHVVDLLGGRGAHGRGAHADLLPAPHARGAPRTVSSYIIPRRLWSTR